MTKVIQVIFTDNRTKGTGVYPDPVRGITEILDFDGNLIMEHDIEKQFTKKDIMDFAFWFRSQQPTDGMDCEELFEKWYHSK